MDQQEIANYITSEQLEQIVAKVAGLVSWDVRQRVMSSDINALISKEIAQAVKDATPYYQYYQNQLGISFNENSIVNGLTAEFTSQTQPFIDRLMNDVRTNVINAIFDSVSHINISELVHSEVNNIVSTRLLSNQWQLPDRSIPSNAVDSNGLQISADNITQGTILNFKSTGISDYSSKINLEISDDATVIGNKLLVKDLHVSGQLVANTLPVAVLERIATITLNYIESKLPNGTFDFAQLDRAELTSLVAANASQRYEQELINTIKEQANAVDIRSKLHSLIQESVAQATKVYKWPNKEVMESPSDNSVFTGLIAEFRSETEKYLAELAADIEQKIAKQINDRTSEYNFGNMVIEYVGNLINNVVLSGKLQFPERSISGKSINPIGLNISASDITAGIVKNFESTGIQDRASQCQLVILDQATVFENKLVTKDLEVAGTVNFKGPVDPDFVDRLTDITIDKIEARHQDGLYDQYAQRVQQTLETNGIDAGKISIGNEKLIENNTINFRITQSNLQKLGVLQELRVQGESLFAESVYITNRRIGINTLNPEKVLDIWDQEVQIVAGKRSKDTGIIGTPINQSLILSSNYKNNLVLNPDGSVQVDQLSIGSVKHTSGRDMPMDDRPIGNIVWNENPYIGGPIGWVSLGGARWAGFGIITE